MIDSGNEDSDFAENNAVLSKEIPFSRHSDQNFNLS